MRVEIPIKTVSVMNVREHWSARAKRAKGHRATTHAMLLGSRRPDLGLPPYCATVTLTRIGSRTLDGDNLQSALKACRDGIADWLRVDDADARVSWCYSQQKCKRGQFGVIVEVS